MHTHNERLQALHYLDPQGETQTLPCDHLVMALGLSPKLGPIAQWGLQIERKQLVVNTETFATDAQRQNLAAIHHDLTDAAQTPGRGVRL